MKILQLIQKHYEGVGLSVPDPITDRRFNSTSIFYLGVLSCFVMTTTAFLLFEARTFSEIAESAYISSGMMVIWVDFIVPILKLETLFSLIRNIESTIQKRENMQSKVGEMNRTRRIWCEFPIFRVKEWKVEEILRECECSSWDMDGTDLFWFCAVFIL